MISYRLSATDFERAAAALSRLAERPRRSAHKVLVEGLTLEDTAAQQDISKEAVRKAVTRLLGAWKGLHFSEVEAARSAATGMLRAALEAGRDVPEGWEPVVVFLPRSMARTVKNLELQQLQKSSGKTAKSTQAPDLTSPRS